MLKRIFASVRQYKKYAIITPFFMIGEAACECTIPFIISMLIDLIRNDSENIGMLLLYSAILIVLAFISLFCGFMGGKFSAIASTGFAANLRHDVFKKVQSYSFTNIDKFQTSSLVTRLTTDINAIQNAFQMMIRIVFRAPLMMIFSIIMASIINVKLTLVFIIILPILAISLGVIMFGAFKIFSKIFPKYDALNASVQENVDGIRVVKSFVREDYEINKFKEASGNLAKNFIVAERLVAFVNPIMQLCIYTAYVLISILGAFAIIESNNGTIVSETYGTLSTGNLSALLSYGIQILSSLMMVAMIIIMLSMSFASMKRIDEVLTEENTIKNPLNPIYEVKDGSVEFINVNFKYSANAERNALENINIDIKSGETIGIIGGTGSSKTTLINLISRLYDVTDGDILVGGVNVKDYDIKTLRDNVAVVLQKNVLFSGTIKENMRWGNENASDEEIIEACKIAQADNFVRSFKDGYDTFIEQGGTNVSGGQKQRLCIARALLKKPKILILDDSTSAVDTKTDALIRNGFKNALPNTTKIIIAQRLSSVEEADKIIVMDNGTIDAIGTNKELIENNKIYKEIYAIQNKIGGAQ